MTSSVRKAAIRFRCGMPSTARSVLPSEHRMPSVTTARQPSSMSVRSSRARSASERVVRRRADHTTVGMTGSSVPVIPRFSWILRERADDEREVRDAEQSHERAIESHHGRPHSRSASSIAHRCTFVARTRMTKCSRPSSAREAAVVSCLGVEPAGTQNSSPHRGHAYRTVPTFNLSRCAIEVMRRV